MMIANLRAVDDKVVSQPSSILWWVYPRLTLIYLFFKIYFSYSDPKAFIERHFLLL